MQTIDTHLREVDQLYEQKLDEAEVMFRQVITPLLQQMRQIQQEIKKIRRKHLKKVEEIKEDRKRCREDIVA
ncbi:unnamed protein product, partial [Didymodactylos carnosus]